MNTNYDIIIVGGGHNGLVCAAYLARAGKKVLVLERNAEVGGAAVTEEIAPGYRVSVASYLISLLLPEVVNDLDLPRHGYKVLGRNPSSFTPLPDGRSLLMGPDAALTHAEIAKFSQRDATAYPQYEAWLTRVAECIEPLLLEPPADLIPLPAHWRRRTWVQKLRELLRGRRLYQALRGMGDELPQTIELLTGAARPILDRWFESDALKATLATDAIIGAQQPISAPGTGYVLLHHVMGLAGGARGVWGYVEGGMGAVTQAMARAAIGFGVEIRCNAEVAEILTANGRASGVRLMNGDVLPAKALASNATAAATFSRLLPASALPASFTAAVQRIDYSSASMKINLAVSELPDFTCLPGKAEVGPQHRGTIHISPTLEYIERAGAGRPPHRADVCAIRAVSARHGPALGRVARRLCRPLHCRCERLRAKLCRVDTASADLDPARYRTPLCLDRRQYFSGRDVATPAVLDAAIARLGRLPYTDHWALPVRRRRASGRWRHRRPRSQLCIGDAAGFIKRS
jgi:phytoene dehydrogenase-like protein